MERKLKGFTIIELMVVIAILAVLSSIGVPAALTWIRDAKIRDANEEARLLYSAVQDYLTELEIKNIDVKENSGSPDEMTMYSCSTDDNLPAPKIDYNLDSVIDDSEPVIRSMIAEYGGFYSSASVNAALKGSGIDLSDALGTEFQGVWAVKFNMNTYTVIEAYWTPYIEGSDPFNPPAQKDVTVATTFENSSIQETYYRNNGVVIGKFPM